MLYITGDTHGEIARFMYKNGALARELDVDDILFICGDFGFVFECNKQEYNKRKLLASLPYTIAFVDGNHENFAILKSYPIEIWNGGKVHVVERDRFGNPKIIHLMRGQVFTVEGQKIFTFGGGISFDKEYRIPNISWWPEEMPSDNEYVEAIHNLNAHNCKVDYVITHTAPEDTINLLCQRHSDEQPLNNFLEWVRENTYSYYKRWYFGHLHDDRDLPRKQTLLWFQLRRMDTNECIDDH